MLAGESLTFVMMIRRGSGSLHVIIAGSGSRASIQTLHTWRGAVEGVGEAFEPAASWDPFRKRLGGLIEDLAGADGWPTGAN